MKTGTHTQVPVPMTKADLGEMLLKYWQQSKT